MLSRYKNQGVTGEMHRAPTVPGERGYKHSKIGVPVSHRSLPHRQAVQC